MSALEACHTGGRAPSVASVLARSCTPTAFATLPTAVASVSTPSPAVVGARVREMPGLTTFVAAVLAPAPTRAPPPAPGARLPPASPTTTAASSPSAAARISGRASNHVAKLAKTRVAEHTAEVLGAVSELRRQHAPWELHGEHEDLPALAVAMRVRAVLAQLVGELDLRRAAREPHRVAALRVASAADHGAAVMRVLEEHGHLALLAAADVLAGAPI